ncbi:sigma-70 family RNA polymerase sigma factor [Ruania albidiflava]|uniref:sigma-70 family RNA polymerase sigma factor n=1 Tax=Ruania albidiflava TaxID=366586 RepID=UPI000417D00A|nr:sigma-70 family RNA polymerase sigma factor [Ruania albidiflava]
MQLRAETDAVRRAPLYAALVADHLHLVDAIAARYRSRGVDWDDLVQVGRLGLCKAICGYEPARGRPFVAYAVPTISGEIKRHFRDTVWAVRPPRRLQEIQLELREREVELEQDLGRAPSDSELAAAAGVEETELREAQVAQHAARKVSIDAPGDSGVAWSERLDTQRDDYAVVEARLVLRPAVRELSRRERRVVYLRFVRGWTQQEIGDELGVSQMQVSRLLSQILAKLRQRIAPLDQAS